MKEKTENREKKKKQAPGKSFRFDPKTMVMIKVYSSLDNQNDTKWVASAIQARAQITKERTSIDWLPYSNVNAGVRKCAMFANENFVWDTEDERQKQFVCLHRPFFYEADGRPSEDRIYYLWQRIDEFVDHWERTQNEANGAIKTAEMMEAHLVHKGVAVPRWRKEGA